MSNEILSRLVEKMAHYRDKLKELKSELESEVEKTELYNTVFTQTMSGQYEISEKDARKHAISVVLKNLKD